MLLGRHFLSASVQMPLDFLITIDVFDKCSNLVYVSIIFGVAHYKGTEQRQNLNF